MKITKEILIFIHANTLWVYNNRLQLFLSIGKIVIIDIKLKRLFHPHGRKTQAAFHSLEDQCMQANIQNRTEESASMSHTTECNWRSGAQGSLWWSFPVNTRATSYILTHGIAWLAASLIMKINESGHGQFPLIISLSSDKQLFHLQFCLYFKFPNLVPFYQAWVLSC